jgi:hypothetical protein
MATVVTAFYPLDKSKHGVAKYHEWLRLFCAIPCQLVVFTDAESAPLIRAARGDRQTVIHESPFDSWKMTSPTMMALWARQHRLDPEQDIHSPELYAVWALKQEAVMIAIAENHFHSRWFIWCDIGIQREPTLQPWYSDFPNTAACERLIAPGRMVFLEVSRIPDSIVSAWKKGSYNGPAPHVTLGGGCIAGDADAWAEFSRIYVMLLPEWDRVSRFCGKDQLVFFRMLASRLTQKPFRLIHARTFGNNGNPWMSFPVILGGKVDGQIDPRFEST